jgi:hypothetical protein
VARTPEPLVSAPPRRPPAGGYTVASVLALQRTVGNRATAAALIQRVNPPPPTGQQGTTGGTGQQTGTTSAPGSQQTPQRAPGDDVEVEGGVEKLAGLLDAASGQVGQATSATQFLENTETPLNAADRFFETGDMPVEGATIGGASAVGGGAAAVAGTVLSSIAVHKARGKQAELQEEWRQDPKYTKGTPEEKAQFEQAKMQEAPYRAAERQRKTGGANVGSSLGGIASQTVGGASAFLEAGSAAASATGAVAGGIGAPLQVFTAVRAGRRAHKQRLRAKELRGTLFEHRRGDVLTAAQAIQKHQDLIDTEKQHKADLEDDLKEEKARRRRRRKRVAKNAPELAGARDEITKLRATLKRLKHARAELVKRNAAQGTIELFEALIANGKQLLADAKKRESPLTRQEEELEETETDVKELEDEIEKLDAWLKQAPDEHRKLTEAKQKIEETVRDLVVRADKGEESPDDIALYAFLKNRAGWIKKVTAATGGAIGAGGGAVAVGVAGAVLSGVAGAALLATPIGWALAGVGATVALGLGGYSLVKWASKRYRRARQAGKGGGVSFLLSIAPWLKVGTSERERLALRLWNFANRGTADGTKATDQVAADLMKKRARETMSALKLEWTEVTGGKHKYDEREQYRDDVVKLIHDKLAS